MDVDKMHDFSISDHCAEVAAQRIVIAALAGGGLIVPVGGLNSGKQVGEFLGAVTTTLADALRARQPKKQ